MKIFRPGAYAIIVMGALLLFAQAGRAALYWTEANFAVPRLVQADTSGAVLSSLTLPASSMPQAIAVDRATKKVFWTELSFVNAHVRAAGGGLTDSGAVVSLQSCLRGVAADSTHGKLYWTSTNLQTGSSLFRANLDGSAAEVLISFGSGTVHAPYGIAIDEKTQTMYWADFDAGEIDRAQTVPSAAPQAVAAGLAGPAGIALDPDSGSLFWTEANAGTISRANPDGSGKAIIISKLAIPLYLCFDRVSRRLFWTEFGGSQVRSAQSDGSDTMTLATTPSPPVGIAVFREPAVKARASTPARPASFGMTAAVAGGGRILRINYQLPHACSAGIAVYDLRSRRIATASPSWHEAGTYERNIDIRNFAPGTYCLRFIAGTFVATKTETIMR